MAGGIAGSFIVEPPGKAASPPHYGKASPFREGRLNLPEATPRLSRRRSLRFQNVRRQSRL